MFIIAKLQEVLSIYIVLVMLGIGLYMGFLQSKTLDTVTHLKREAKFTKIIGYIYIVLAVISGAILLI